MEKIIEKAKELGALIEKSDIVLTQRAAKKEFDDNATLSSFTGFSFVTENVQAELASCANVDKQYKTQLMLGAIDPDSIYDEYMNEMKKAGMDALIIKGRCGKKGNRGG